MGFAAVRVGVTNFHINLAVFGATDRYDRLRLARDRSFLKYLRPNHRAYLERICRLADEASQSRAIAKLPNIIAWIGQQSPKHALDAKHRAGRYGKVARGPDGKIGAPLMPDIQNQTVWFGPAVFPLPMAIPPWTCSS